MRDRQFLEGDEIGPQQLLPIGAHERVDIGVLRFGGAAKGAQALVVQFHDRRLHQLPTIFEMMEHSAARQARFLRDLGCGRLGVAIFDEAADRRLDEARLGLRAFQRLMRRLYLVPCG